MLAALNHVIVEVDLAQSEEAVIGGNHLKTGRRYNENFREKNPCIAKVISGLGIIKDGDYLICNYNYFDIESPFYMYGNTFSIPIDEEILAKIDEDGELYPLCGNLLVERLEKQNIIPIPDELKKNYNDRGIVSRGTSKFKRGDFVFWLRMSDYEIVYFWNGIERRAIKVFEKEIVGVLKNP